MLQKKDEQRSVELEQNGDSSTKADVTMSSSHSAKPFVSSSLSLSTQEKDKLLVEQMKQLYDSVGFNRATESSLSVK